MASSLQNQLDSLYKTNWKNIQIRVAKGQQQDGGSDCDPFTIAFLTDVAFRNDPEKVIYDQDALRLHLAKCLENRVFEPFPRQVSSKIRRVRVRATSIKLPIYSICRMPERFSKRMLDCDRCHDWFHDTCRL